MISDPGFLDLKSAVVCLGKDQAPKSGGLNSLEPDLIPARLDRYNLHSVEISAESPEPGWLILSDLFYPGWEATLDGKPVPIFSGNYLFRAVEFPAGKHQVRFQYRPGSFLVGVGLFGFGFVVLRLDLTDLCETATPKLTRNSPPLWPARKTRRLVVFAILALEAAIYRSELHKILLWRQSFLSQPGTGRLGRCGREIPVSGRPGQYRPLTYVLYSYVIYPIAGLDLFRNHLFPVLFHATNTVLTYFIARHIFARSLLALLAAFFFGVSTVGAYISYDNTFIPDYLYVFFYLGALLSLCRCLESNPVLNFVIALVLFLFALFSKEAAVSFAAGAFMVLLLATEARRLKERRQPARLNSVGRVRSRPAVNVPTWRIGLMCAPFAVATLVYVGWHLAVRGGRSIPPTRTSLTEVTWRNVQSKLADLAQAGGLSSPMSIEWQDLVVNLPLMIWLAWVVARTLRGILRGESIFRAGMLSTMATGCSGALCHG